MGYQVKITDANDQIIGELMSAENSDILTLLNKGMKVINVQTNTEFKKEDLLAQEGVSDGLIEI